MIEGAIIDAPIFGTAGMEAMLRDKIIGRLGQENKTALKSLNVDVYRATTIPEAMQLAKFPNGLLTVKGYLALDDSGVGMKYFEFKMEQKLSRAQDEEVADDLAHQCLACFNAMKRDRKKNPHRRKLVLH
jgi:hypothetical protein